MAQVRRKSAGRFAAFAVALSLAAFGCGGSDDESADETGAAGQETAAETPAANEARVDQIEKCLKKAGLNPKRSPNPSAGASASLRLGKANLFVYESRDKAVRALSGVGTFYTRGGGTIEHKDDVIIGYAKGTPDRLTKQVVGCV